MSTATHADSDDALPTTAQLSAAKATHVLDSHGTRISVASLFDQAQAQQLPLVLVFTRHFHCGMCKEFVRALAESSILTRVELVIVSPGEAAGVETYKASVGSPPFKFFADPQLHLYHALGVTRRNLELGDAKEKVGAHHKVGLTHNVISSVIDLVKSGTQALKGGDFKQLGGEFVFSEKGEPVRAHRMRHTRDHSEVEALEQAVQSR